MAIASEKRRPLRYLPSSAWVLLREAIAGEAGDRLADNRGAIALTMHTMDLGELSPKEVKKWRN